MTKTTRYKIIRYLAYTLELLIISMVQQTPGLIPEILKTRPVLLIPAVITIAMFESEFTAMIFGMIGGLLIDFAGGGLLGFHALVLAVICYCIGYACINLFKINLFTASLIGFVAVCITILLQWLFFFVLAGYAHCTYALFHHYLPRIVYTFLFVPLSYFLNRFFALALKTPED